ncbi:MAG: prolipoprotein diacylglyceryl transferase [Bacteroidales bacterium]|nr:prolipoprotein diacylglyceryl transferase [Bacteroidales bacterium]MBQ4287398.1 prolipoprotein diacylglyceryl transferase [Bacteroidales bacterium]
MLDFLFVNWNVDPEIFRIGGFALRWYSVLFVSGFILGWFIFRGFFRREGVPETMLDSLLYTLLIATIVGARLGHCLFYQPDYYFGSWKGFLEIFMPWKGGLASHGGGIALILSMFWYAKHYGRKYGMDGLWLLDHLVIAAAFAATFIRLGNLFNSEIYGDVTSLPWGFVFQRRGEVEPKHPTQIYEALTYLIIGIVLMWAYRKKLDKMYRGSFFGIFLILCFGMRFIIEFIKEPQVDFESSMALDMGQWLSIPFVLFGALCVIYAYVKKIPAKLVPPVPPTKSKKEPTHYAKSLSE